ncbi:MAG: alpha/beta hydrolase [Pseudohongiellaceae bacterium]
MQTQTLDGSSPRFDGLSTGGSQFAGMNPVSHEPDAWFTLSDGNRLCYDELGDRSGFPILYFHNTGSSRLEGAFFDRDARKSGFRLIAVDRPGIGGSDFKAHHDARNFCADLIELMDSLGIERVGLMSFAAGGTYALTLAHYYPDRVRFSVSLAGIPLVADDSQPCSYAVSCMRRALPPLIRVFIRLRHTFSATTASDYLERLRDTLCYTDRKTLADPRVINLLEADLAESRRQGFQGVARDTSLCLKPLGFDIATLRLPVHIWQGSADHLSSRSNCEYLATTIPDSLYFRVPNRGHFFFLQGMEEVFGRLRPVLANPVPQNSSRRASRLVRVAA